VYLVMIRTPNGVPLLATLVDEYPSWQTHIPVMELTSAEDVSLRLRRDPGCDRERADIVIRTAPGDAMAVLPQRLGYMPQLPRSVPPGEVIPCYRVLRS